MPGKIDEADKNRATLAAKTCCAKFTVFIAKFAELIFIVSLGFSSGLKIFWCFISNDNSE